MEKNKKMIEVLRSISMVDCQSKMQQHDIGELDQ